MYNEEIKYKIIRLLEYKTIKEIAEEFDISYSTLYRWQKSKKDSELIKKLMLEKKYEEALVIGKSYPNNEVIKSQVMSIYMKKKDYSSFLLIILTKALFLKLKHLITLFIVSIFISLIRLI